MRIDGQERGSTLVEAVGLMGAVLAFTLAMTAPLSGQGGALGDAVAARLHAAVGGTDDPAGRPVHLFRRGGTTQSVRERRAGGGDLPVRVARDEIRLSPLLQPIAAAWQSDSVHATPGGHARVELSTCVLCITGEWDGDAGLGATADQDGKATGMHAGGAVSIRAALVAAEVLARVERSTSWATGSAQARLRGLVGGDARAEATLEVGRTRQAVDLEAGASVGAVGRAQTDVGVDVFGIALQNTAYAEGWAGAGAKARATATHDGGRVTWNFGWGAAVGLGGGAGWSGSADVHEMSPKQRTAARAGAAVLLSGFPVFAPLVPLHLLHSRGH